MDKEKIKQAIDHFENDEFTDSKEILKKEIGDKFKDHLDQELGMTGNTEDDE